MPLEGTCILSVRLESLEGNEQALAVARCALLQVNSRREEQQHHRQERKQEGRVHSMLLAPRDHSLKGPHSLDQQSPGQGKPQATGVFKKEGGIEVWDSFPSSKKEASVLEEKAGKQRQKRDS